MTNDTGNHATTFIGRRHLVAPVFGVDTKIVRSGLRRMKSVEARTFDGPGEKRKEKIKTKKRKKKKKEK